MRSPVRILTLFITIAGVGLAAVPRPRAEATPATAPVMYPLCILPGDYPDPSILRDGPDYYLTHSPFLYTPGFLIWHSRDLVNWRPITRAMTAVVGSAMAPDLVKVGDKYHIYFPAAGLNWVLTADDIRGPWSEPVKLQVSRIDPGHAVGEDGKRYLFLSDGGRVPLSDDGMSVTGRMENVYSGWEFPAEWETEGKWLESPKLVRRGDHFYMVSAQGGTAGPPTSHMAIVARSRSIHGPWENSPHNPLVHTYHADERWWSKGHGTLIDDVNGHWWFVYHAYENGHYPLGRATLLEPIDWTDDGWPVPAREPHPLPADDRAAPTLAGMPLSDDFSAPVLGPQWTTWRDFAGVETRENALFLRAKGASPADARLLLVTATDHAYEVSVDLAVSADARAGLVLFYNEKAFVGLSVDPEGITIHRSAEQADRIARGIAAGTPMRLRIINHNDRCTFLVGHRDNWEQVADDVDTTQLHHNRHKGFLALRPGLMAAGEGEAKFDNFVYRAALGRRP